ncbi:hypothetical protein D3C72_1976910 [compost metagenome]
MPPASTTNWIESNSSCTPSGRRLTSPPEADITYDVSARLAPMSSGPSVMAAQ